MWTIVVPLLSAMASIARCDSEPLPIDPKLYLPGSRFKSAMQFRDGVNITLEFTASALGCVTSCVIGAMSVLRIVGQLGEQQRVDGERPADADADGGAVGRGLGDGVGADVAAGARLVIDDEGLTELLLQMVGDHPGDHVGRRTGAERHDDP